MASTTSPQLPLDLTLLRPGLRLAVGLSGGADSVALLRALVAIAAERGLVLCAAHLHHGLRGAEADADQQFCRELAATLGIAFHTEQVDVAAAALATATKPAESLEEAARRLRYNWFRHLLASGHCDAVATAHTRDDQAETVLARLLRGTWTEGLAGIYPVVVHSEGQILRPLLGASRRAVEQYLRDLGQNWREDASNQDFKYTRNRIRHELLPSLEEWNPRLRESLGQMAELARDEEAFWNQQVSWLAPQVILAGKPVRGGGRAAAAVVAVDVTRLADQPVALQRRLLREAASRLGAQLDFAATENLRQLALSGKASQKCTLPGGLLAERSHRELRLSGALEAEANSAPETHSFAVPGTLELAVHGVRIEVEGVSGTAVLRPWRAGDRVHLRYSSGPRKIKEVLERMKVTGDERASWPVLELDGRLVWMKGVELEPEPGLALRVVRLS